MIKKILKVLLTLLILFTVFSLWMSPSLGGILPGGKDTHAKDIRSLSFTNEKQLDLEIPYKAEVNKNDLVKLREQFKLDTLISNDKTDFENVMSVQSWVHSRWIHDGDNAPEKYDAIYILEQAEKGKRFRCVEYAFVTGACLKSLGYVVRGLWLKTRDVNEVNYGAGHVVNEVYLKDKKKWFFIDPQFDIIVLKDGVPLNAVEFQKAIFNKEKIDVINPSQEISDEEYIKWIAPYLFYFTTSLNNGAISNWDRVVGTKKELTLVPLSYEPPTYFQRLFRIRTNHTTNSLVDFYPVIE